MAAAALANVSYWSTESVKRLSRFQVPFSLALTLPSLPIPVSRALSLRPPPFPLHPPAAPAVHLVLTSRPLVHARFLQVYCAV